jgi:hypothetical protein
MGDHAVLRSEIQSFLLKTWTADSDEALVTGQN